MAKKRNMAWDVQAEGKYYLVQCVDKGNKYDLYVDEEYLTTVWKKQEICEDIEQDIRIGGKLCQFVAYDGVPDISVDGVLLNAEEEYLKAERKRRRYDILTGFLMTSVGMLAIYFFLIMKLGGEEILGGWLALVMAVLFAAWGIYSLFSAVFRKVD